MGLIQDFLSRKPPSPIFHYASAASAISIITHKNIWASKITHLNDSSEHTHAAELIARELKKRSPPLPGPFSRALMNLGLIQPSPDAGSLHSSSSVDSDSDTERKRHGRNILSFAQDKKVAYVASFSEEGDSLSQWRAYCSNGNGYSLGFDASSVQRGPLGPTFLVRCVYQDQEKLDLIAALVNDCESRDSDATPDFIAMIVDILVVMASMKHVSFAEEREWRLINFGIPVVPCYRSGRHGIVPYVEIPFGDIGQLILSNVCVGPNSDTATALQSLRSLVEAHQDETQSVTFTSSSTPYRQ